MLGSVQIGPKIVRVKLVSDCFYWEKMVGGTRFELVTPTMSKRVPLANGKFGEEKPVAAGAEVGRKSPEAAVSPM
jgi:hypothetical protein